ncbi:MAG TPA: hypothetical protein VGQ95_03690 [Chthoniobacterales bacterium]|nr:hypothetical protein [Chthoniobacterales bacterium]
MKILRTSLVVIINLTIAACASGPKNSAALQSVRTVSIDPNVKMPAKMEFFGLSEMLAGAAVVGAVGPAGSGAMTPSHRMAPDFGIPESLRTELAAALQKSGKFVVKKQAPSDAVLRLGVELYGFHSAEMFARRVNPELAMTAKLVRSDGTEVWRFRNYVNHLTSGTPAILPEKIKENPQLGVDAFRVAARLCGEKALEKLQK